MNLIVGLIKKSLFVFLLMPFLMLAKLQAQDTLFVSLRQADSIFLNRNLLLLAARYQVEAAKAGLQQAKIWNNPSVYAELSAYNHNTNKYLDIGSNGEKIFSLQQSVRLAGKRSNSIKLAAEQLKMNEYQFYDLLRALKLELRINYFGYYYSKTTLQTYEEQLRTLEQTINAFEEQQQKGNIPLKDLLRLKSLYFQLNNERTELLVQKLQYANNLKILLQSEVPIYPIAQSSERQTYQPGNLNLNELLNDATANRSDLKISQSLLNQSEINYQLQKSNKVPDLKLSGMYDQQGSYITNYLGFGLGVELPFYNRNQGNINVAKFQNESQKLEYENKLLVVKNEVSVAYQKLLQLENLYNSIEKNFPSQLHQLNEGVSTNFRKRNISLLEFIDLFESYLESIRSLNNLKIDRINAYEQLNYVVGKELFFE